MSKNVLYEIIPLIQITYLFTSPKQLRERRSLWHFIKSDKVDPTNNHAERQLRYAVIWRKKIYDTQSARGMVFDERILTTFMICRQQGRNLVSFISDCLRKKVAAIYPAPV